MAFNKDLFRTSKSDDGFNSLTVGNRYILNLESAALGNAANSGRYQCVFKWRVSEDDEELPGKLVYQCIGLSDKDGKDSPEGYKAFSRILQRMGVPAEVFERNPELVLLNLSGIKVRMAIKTNSKNEDFPYWNIEKLLVEPDLNTLTSVPEKGGSDDPALEEEIEVKLGMRVFYKSPTSKKEETGEIMAFIEATNEITVKCLSYGKNLFETVDANICSTASQTEETEVEEEIEEKVEEKKLAVGMMVDFVFKGEKKVGQVILIDEATNSCQVKDGDKKYKISLEKVTVKF